jgi:polyhydroxyalkanoate synthase
LLSGPLCFVLGASGHIAGVINSPSKNKRNYWLADSLPETADAWYAQAVEARGSWWPVWSAWLSQHGGLQIKPRATLGHAKYPALEPAPGSYVMQRA